MDNEKLLETILQELKEIRSDNGKILLQIEHINTRMEHGDKRFEMLEKNQKECIVKHLGVAYWLDLGERHCREFEEMLNDWKTKKETIKVVKTNILGIIIDYVVKIIVIGGAALFGLFKLLIELKIIN
jgi:chromosome segregation ATPase